MISSPNEEINTLISACLSGNATSEEISELEQWVGSSAGNRKYYLQIKNIWDLTNRKLTPDEIVTEKAYLAFQYKIRTRFNRSLLASIFQKAAAILVLPLLAISIWLLTSKYISNPVQNPVYCEVSAAFGTRSVVTLSDGSTIWLNSGSSLRYPQKFTGNSREVYLKGEGYFEVEADTKTPFIVHTNAIHIRATGTKFNVNASGLCSSASVTLVSGAVTVSKSSKGRSVEELADMLPHEHFTYDTVSGAMEIIKEDTYKHIAWKDGKLIFRNDPLENVLNRIGYFYNVDMVILDDKLKEYRYRATFEEESIEEIMNLLKLSSPVDFRVEERKPLPDGSFPRKKIIIFPVKN